MPNTSFSVGDRVYDKRDREQTIATLVGCKTHTNGSRKWVCQYPDGRYYVWEVDLRLAPEPAEVVK